MTYEEMEQIAGLDLSVPEERERALAWRIEDRPTLEWAMGILANGEREAEAIRSACAEARRRIDAREIALLTRNVRATEWIRAAVTDYARAHRKDLLVKGKTAHLVHGEIAFVDRTKATVEIDNEAAALEWCRAQPEALGLVRTKYEIAKKALDAFVLMGPEIPPGVKVVPPTSTLTLSPSQPETIDVPAASKEIEP
jgi:phage host-nuclease inhibitor protein Gam